MKVWVLLPAIPTVPVDVDSVKKNGTGAVAVVELVTFAAVRVGKKTSAAGSVHSAEAVPVLKPVPVNVTSSPAHALLGETCSRRQALA